MVCLWWVVGRPLVDCQFITCNHVPGMLLVMTKSGNSIASCCILTTVTSTIFFTLSPFEFLIALCLKFTNSVSVSRTPSRAAFNWFNLIYNKPLSISPFSGNFRDTVTINGILGSAQLSTLMASVKQFIWVTSDLCNNGEHGEPIQSLFVEILIRWSPSWKALQIERSCRVTTTAIAPSW